MAKSRLYNHESTMGRNMTHLKHKYNLQVEDILTFSKERLKDHCYKKWKAAVNEDFLFSAHIVKELIMIKDNRLCITFSYNAGDFSPDFILNYLCTN